MAKLCPFDAGLDESSNSAHPNGVRGAVPLVSISAMYTQLRDIRVRWRRVFSSIDKVRIIFSAMPAQRVPAGRQLM